MIDTKYINNYLDKFDLNIKTRGSNPRFFDQKVQPDVVEVIAYCILNYNKKHFFTIRDIWNNKLSEDYIYEILRKPKASEPKAENEYDKFFSQPICFLTYFGVLFRERKQGKYYHTVLNKKILEYISDNQNNALNFICICLTKFFKINNFISKFDNFFKDQDRDSYLELREGFFNFLWNNTKIKRPKKYEPGRIFTPIINALAFKKNKKGSAMGNISKNPIYRDELIYGRPNWKDILTDKPREKTREEWQEETLDAMDEQVGINSAERSSKKSIVERHGDKSEYSNKNKATQTHHIFPRSFYLNICHYRENLIRITPDEHFAEAHPSSNTQRVDKKFQVKLLFAKLKSIEHSLKKKDDFYDLSLFIKVLNVGYKIELPKDLSIQDIKNVLKAKSNNF